MNQFVKRCQLFKGSKFHVQKKIGELEKVGKKSHEPTEPGKPVKRSAYLKKDIDEKDRKGKVEE